MFTFVRLLNRAGSRRHEILHFPIVSLVIDFRTQWLNVRRYKLYEKPTSNVRWHLNKRYNKLAHTFSFAPLGTEFVKLGQVSEIGI